MINRNVNIVNYKQYQTDGTYNRYSSFSHAYSKLKRPAVSAGLFVYFIKDYFFLLSNSFLMRPSSLPVCPATEVFSLALLVR